MIVFLVTGEHQHTLRALAQEPSLNIRIATYGELFASVHAARATYVFCDLHRLPLWQLRQASRVYRQLRDGGMRVLNDPSKWPTRWGLLRNLYRQGVNTFDAYRVEEGLIPVRWPVFLKSEGDDAGTISGLIHSWEDAQRAIDRAVQDGATLAGLVLVEYAAEPVAPGIFRKLSEFRIGSSYFAGPTLHEGDWRVIHGSDAITPAGFFEDDLRTVRENPHEAKMKAVFGLTGIEYGRAEFSMVGGSAQTYGINTNPGIAFPNSHRSEARMEAFRVFKTKLFEALTKIDTPALGAKSLSKIGSALT